MRYRYIFLMLVATFMCVQCGTSKKIKYNIPENYPKEKRKELIAILDKGRDLYKVNCSDCHGIFTKGRDKIPNFTNTQIDNYSTRFILRDVRNHAVARQLSPEQLNSVLFFLRYKRPANPDSAGALYRKF